MSKVTWWDGANGPYEADVPDEHVAQFELDHPQDDASIQTVEDRDDIVPSDVNENQTGADNPDDTTADGTGEAAHKVPTPLDVHIANDPYKGDHLS